MAGPVISARELSLVFQTADAPVYAENYDYGVVLSEASQARAMALFT